MGDNINYMSEKNEQELIEEEAQKLPSGSVERDTAISALEKNNARIKHKGDFIDKELDKIEEMSNDLDFDSDVIEERLEEVREAEKPKKKKKSKIMNVIFLVINIVLMVFIVSGFLQSFGDGLDIGAVIEAQGKKLWWLVAGLGLYFIFVLTETGIFSSLIKATTGRRRPYLSYKVAITGKYYDSITPFSVGGQPSRIVTLTKDGMSAGISTSLPIIKIIVYNIVYTFFILAFFIFGMPLISASSDRLFNFIIILFEAIAVVGLILTAFSSVIFLLIGNGKLVGRTLARWGVKIGYKLKIVKNYRQTYNKIMIQVREYQNSMDFLKRNKWVMVKCIFCCILQILAYFSVPFTVVLAFSTNIDVNFVFWVTCVAKILICQMAAVIIPLPGGTGMMEIGFIFIFSNVLGNNVVWGLLAWRILTYYILILHGFVQTLFDSVVSTLKNRRLKKLKQT